MATEKQIADFKDRLSRYKRKYLKKEFNKLDESATRIMINSFLTEVLGYKELEEIKTEFRIRHEYADYVIQLKRKKHFVVEAKSIQLDLSDKHLRQSLNYAANEGIDWIVLHNGRQIELYKVNFGKPISTTRVYSIDLLDKDAFKKAPEQLWCLTKPAVEKGDLEDFWKRFNALAPEALAKLVYSEDVVKLLRRWLKDDTGIYFNTEDIAASLHTILSHNIILKPKLKTTKKKEKSINTSLPKRIVIRDKNSDGVI
jgi:hypothetical protein